MNDKDPKFVSDEFWRRSKEASGYGRLGLQILALIHGGALAGMLATLGPSIVNRGALYFGWELVGAMFVFASGLFLILVSLFAAFQSSFLRAPRWNEDLGRGISNDKDADRFLWIANWCGIISVLCFPVAFVLLACAFLYS